MKNRFLSVALLFLAIAAGQAQDQAANRAALQQQIAQLQTQLGPLKQNKDDAAAAVLKIKFVDGSYVLDGQPADMAAAIAKHSAAVEQYAPVEKQLLDAQAALRALETPSPSIATQNPAPRYNPPPPGSDDPDRLLGGDDPGVPHNPGSYLGNDVDINLDDVDLYPGGGHAPSGHGPSGNTTSTHHPGGSGGHSAPGHSNPGHSGSGSGHSGSGSGHSGQSGSGHSGGDDPN